MAYTLFYTDFKVTQAQYQANKAGLTTYLYQDKDDALGMARQINKRGGIAWEIESEGGPTMNREQIAEEVRRRGSELDGRPKVR